MSAHTPGPWTICTPYRDEYNKRVPIKVGSAPAITIAETLSAPKGDLADANARLIAAAPEMLEALQKVAIHFQDTDAPLGELARAIIRKATGEI